MKERLKNMTIDSQLIIKAQSTKNMAEKKKADVSRDKKGVAFKTEIGGMCKREKGGMFIKEKWGVFIREKGGGGVFKTERECD